MRYILIILLFTSCRVVETYQYREGGSRVVYKLDTSGEGRHCGAESYDRVHNRTLIRRGQLIETAWNVGIVRKYKFLWFNYYK